MIDFIELHLNGQISYWITIRASELLVPWQDLCFFYIYTSQRPKKMI